MYIIFITQDCVKMGRCENTNFRVTVYGKIGEYTVQWGPQMVQKCEYGWVI